MAILMTIYQPIPEAPKMFGVYVQQFSSNVGYGSNGSSLSMTLVEDPDNFSHKKNSSGQLLYLDSNGNDTTSSSTGGVPNQPSMFKDPLIIKHAVFDDEGKWDGKSYTLGFPEVGSPCQFVFEGFEFAGLFQRYTEKSP